MKHITEPRLNKKSSKKTEKQRRNRPKTTAARPVPSWRRQAVAGLPAALQRPLVPPCRSTRHQSTQHRQSYRLLCLQPEKPTAAPAQAVTARGVGPRREPQRSAAFRATASPAHAAAVTETATNACVSTTATRWMCQKWDSEDGNAPFSVLKTRVIRRSSQAKFRASHI